MPCFVAELPVIELVAPARGLSQLEDHRQRGATRLRPDEHAYPIRWHVNLD